MKNTAPRYCIRKYRGDVSYWNDDGGSTEVVEV